VISDSDELELIAVCDSDQPKAKALAEKSGATAYVDYREMVANETLDIVSVLTESGSHARIGINVADHVDALVIEKPMALTLSDADALIDRCQRAGTQLFVVKQNRYNPAVARLRSALEDGRFGKLVLGTVRVRWRRDQAYYDRDPWRGTWAEDGGVFTNQASHHIDLLQWMMGPVEAVQAYTATALVDIEAEDTGIAVLKFANGALGVIEATTATRPIDLEGSLSILGATGSVVIGGFAVNRIDTWNFAQPEEGDEEAADASTIPPNVYGFGHRAFYRDVLDCMASGARSMLDGLEGRKSLEIINALYESAHSGREVRLRYVPKGVPLGGSR